MKRKIPTTFLTTSVLLVGLSTFCFAAEIPEYVDINLQTSNPAFAEVGKDSKNVPDFSHAKHATTFLENNSTYSSRAYENKFTCTACHEGVEKNTDIQLQATKMKQEQAVKQAGGVKKYMHGICLDCHKSMKKAKLSTGPTSCKGCHKPS